VYLVDPLAKDIDLNIIKEIFIDQSILKVFHSARQDIEVLMNTFNIIPWPIYDTQVAANFILKENDIGYGNLVETLCGKKLNKKYQVSDWSRRPLKEKQIEYAALDVEYLIHLYIEQEKELSKSNKLNWFNQDIEKLIYSTFNESLNKMDLERSISKAEENDLLKKMNLFIERIANEEGINSTLFFSKKTQKDFLRLVFISGIEEACKEITLWRKQLIREDLFNLLK
jgi:ribonuclease D